MSCIFDNDGRGSSRIIKDFSIGARAEDEESTVCKGYYLPTENSCHPKKCPSGSHEGSSEEIENLKKVFNEQAEDDEFDEELIEEITTNFEQAKVICIEGSGVLRPDNAISIKDNFCACYNNSPIMVSGCSSYCGQLSIKGDNKDRETLYGRVLLLPEIELHPDLGHLYGWCHNEINGSDYTAPGCKFIVQSSGGISYDLPIEVRTNNTFIVDLSGIPKDETYIGKIGEVESGAEVFSDNIQFRLVDPPEEKEIAPGPLKIAPISQYTCISRPNSQHSTSLDETHYNLAFKTHYYHLAGTSPPALDEATINRGIQFCHDIMLYGLRDSPRYARLEHIPQHLSLWDTTDIRFLDMNQNQSLDIHEAISKRLFKDYGIKRNLDIFSPLIARSSPAAKNEIVLGHRMKFWIKQNSTETFCPKQKDYNGTDPIFKVLKDYVGIDTEASMSASVNPSPFQKMKQR